MLKIDKIEISFIHHHTIYIFHGEEFHDRVTDCVINSINDDKSKTLVCKASARCSPKDNFSKAVGRKIALTRALRILTKNNLIEKGQRALIWDLYFKTSPKSKI